MDCIESGMVEDSDLEVLEIEENNFSFPPRFRLEFRLTDQSNASKSNKVTIQVNGTRRQVKINILLENLGKYINRIVFIYDY